MNCCLSVPPSYSLRPQYTHACFFYSNRGLPFYSNPVAISQLERDRMPIQPHHVGLDPNDSLVNFQSEANRATTNDPNLITLFRYHLQPPPPDAAGFQLPREFVFNITLY